LVEKKVEKWEYLTAEKMVENWAEKLDNSSDSCLVGKSVAGSVGN
jgi:hypothetical protein